MKIVHNLVGYLRCVVDFCSILLSAGNNETENVAHFLFSGPVSSHGRLLRLRTYRVPRSIRPLSSRQHHHPFLVCGARRLRCFVSEMLHAARNAVVNCALDTHSARLALHSASVCVCAKIWKHLALIACAQQQQQQQQ